MVYLSRIYTKKGDNGTTQLGDGSTLPKHHLRVSSYGTVDELSSFVGVGIVDGLAEGASEEDAALAKRLQAVQNDLFDIGSDLCVPGEAGEKLRITAAYTERIEAWIDEVNADLEPLTSFVLPGGSRMAAHLHVMRTVCRRAEREVTALTEVEADGAVNPEVQRYLNRLSDLFFVLSRAANDGGKRDVLWVPGKNR